MLQYKKIQTPDTPKDAWADPKFVKDMKIVFECRPNREAIDSPIPSHSHSPIPNIITSPTTTNAPSYLRFLWVLLIFPLLCCFFCVLFRKKRPPSIEDDMATAVVEIAVPNKRRKKKDRKKSTKKSK